MRARAHKPNSKREVTKRENAGYALGKRAVANGGTALRAEGRMVTLVMGARPVLGGILPERIVEKQCHNATTAELLVANFERDFAHLTQRERELGDRAGVDDRFTPEMALDVSHELQMCALRHAYRRAGRRMT